MKILVVGKGKTLLELMSYFSMKWGHDVSGADGDEEIAEKIKSLNGYDAVVIYTSTVMKYFKNDAGFFVKPSVVCSIESSLKTPVEKSGGIFVNKGSRLLNELYVALCKIGGDIAKEKR